MLASAPSRHNKRKTINVHQCSSCYFCFSICRLEFSWASVELTKTEYRVCEGKGPLSVTVQRKGNMQDSSYVTLKVKKVALYLQLVGKGRGNWPLVHYDQSSSWGFQKT